MHSLLTSGLLSLASSVMRQLFHRDRVVFVGVVPPILPEVFWIVIIVTKDGKITLVKLGENQSTLLEA